MRRFTLRVLVAVTCLTQVAHLHACTVFAAAQDGVVLFAGNEDWKDPYNRIRFFPREKGKYGRVYIGCARHGSGEMGMNDQGLAFDALSVPKQPVTPANKPEYLGNLVEKVLEECATVAEAIEVFGRYDQSRYDHSQLMFADRTGDAVLIDANNVYRKKGRYLLATNFRRSDRLSESYPCQRFHIADRMLRESSTISLDLFRKILAATHMEGATPTQYSAIFDLKKRQIHLYHFHNFESVVTIDVQAELTKGWSAVDVASLFPATYASGTYVSSVKKPVTGVVLKAITNDGIESAIKKCEFLREFDSEHYDASPSPVIVAGLELMWAGKRTEAIRWLKYAAEIFPDEPDSHLCLGEA
ncbi:MAG: hypothetical protein JSU86_14820, partial [Phycisphaerales bacterium]